MSLTARPRTGGGTISQSAVRTLFILDHLGHPVPEACPVSGAVKVLESETKLQKVDFWVRNPDYLASEVLNDVEAGTLERDIGLQEAEQLLADTVPELHTYSMTRYLRGAWERRDNAIGLLKYLGHVDIRRQDDGLYSPNARRDFYLLRKGVTAIERLRTNFPVLAWYDQQAARVARFAYDATGAELKKRQYANEIYEETPLGAAIPSIAPRVRQRLHELRMVVS
jgi:hypothetical protein